MSDLFADRIHAVSKSFIREILKITQEKDTISFAGGLPNPDFFPVREILSAAIKVLENDGKNALQYNVTEGYSPLREYICERYFLTKGLKPTQDEILITSGSQQAIAIICKTFLNKGEHVILERPSYLGAVQAISFYEPVFHSVTLLEDGIDIITLEEIYNKNKVKLFYYIPNFQNPTGITYTNVRRSEMAKILDKYDTLFIEDDPYYDLRFSGENLPSLKSYFENNVILIGSFSKIVAPSFRLGWIYAQKDLMEKIVISKQASDLHSNYFSQRIIYQYLVDNSIEDHISKIRDAYRKQKDKMLEMMDIYFPEEVKYTRPEGGMFLWVTLPEYISSEELFHSALKEKIVFVPGHVFFVDNKGNNTFRLNFTNSNELNIEIGIKKLANLIKKMFVKNKVCV